MCDGYNVPGIVEIEMEKSLTSYQVVPGCLLCPGFRERNMQSRPSFTRDYALESRVWITLFWEKRLQAKQCGVCAT